MDGRTTSGLYQILAGMLRPEILVDTTAQDIAQVPLSDQRIDEGRASDQVLGFANTEPDAESCEVLCKTNSVDSWHEERQAKTLLCLEQQEVSDRMTEPGRVSHQKRHFASEMFAGPWVASPLLMANLPVQLLSERSREMTHLLISFPFFPPLHRQLPDDLPCSVLNRS